MITVSVSIKTTPPIRINKISVFVIKANPANSPPNEWEPVSPIKTCAGLILNNKNPRMASMQIKMNKKT